MATRPGGCAIEAKTTLDLERTLGMTGGNIFTARCRGRSPRMTSRWTRTARLGCSDAHDRILLCARDPAAAVRCRASAATTPQWRAGELALPF